MNKYISLLGLIAAIAFIFTSCDGGSSSSGTEEPVQQQVFSAYKMEVMSNTGDAGQPEGAFLFVFEKNIGLQIKGELHGYNVIEESPSRIEFDYHGGPLEGGKTGKFVANLDSGQWSLKEFPSGRDMSGDFERIEFDPNHRH